ncbi:hypothetical protein D5086_004035 [Populus alba]|uniref:Uncharacterized protein n=1 Tax=Populus alba TaxID=43335 RepID=A0ACC4CQG5_POPAL
MERKRHWIWLDKIMHKRERQRLFLDRGGELLEELIAFCNGRSNPIRNFSLNQLQKAIDDYHPSVHLKTLKDVDDFNFKCYEGILEQRLLLIKMFRDCDTGVYRDIVVSSQMSSHNNVLKLSEKTDVYSFGVLLLLLLTGRRTLQERISVTNCVKDLVEQDRVHEAVDPRIRGNRGEAIDQQQLEAFIELALRCTNHSGEDRPLMIEVAKELQRIERSITAAP